MRNGKKMNYENNRMTNNISQNNKMDSLLDV